MNVLFLCTDNFTRSIIAELFARDYIRKHRIPNLSVTSAGINAKSDISNFSTFHLDLLNEKGIDVSAFTDGEQFYRTQFNRVALDYYDVVIAMSKEHQTYIQNHFQKEIPLFNELAGKGLDSISLVESDDPFFEQQIAYLIEHIQTSIPFLIQNVLEKHEMV